ncbi:hypothetical protein [Bacillus mycoides]|uniref:hypothetical protein n=1 Tax=Bacillus mycoides TaxID=1405 RepID=UPI003D655D29
MKFKKAEQETVITFDAKIGEWTFYTCVPSHIRLFTSKTDEISEKIEVLTECEGNPTSIKFNVPKESINPKNFIKKKRTMSKVQLKNLRHSS